MTTQYKFGSTPACGCNEGCCHFVSRAFKVNGGFQANNYIGLTNYADHAQGTVIAGTGLIAETQLKVLYLHKYEKYEVLRAHETDICTGDPDGFLFANMVMTTHEYNTYISRKDGQINEVLYTNSCQGLIFHRVYSEVDNSLTTNVNPACTILVCQPSISHGAVCGDGTPVTYCGFVVQNDPDVPCDSGLTCLGCGITDIAGNDARLVYQLPDDKAGDNFTETFSNTNYVGEHRTDDGSLLHRHTVTLDSPYTIQEMEADAMNLAITFVNMPFSTTTTLPVGTRYTGQAVAQGADVGSQVGCGETTLINGIITTQLRGSAVVSGSTAYDILAGVPFDLSGGNTNDTELDSLVETPCFVAPLQPFNAGFAEDCLAYSLTGVIVVAQTSQYNITGGGVGCISQSLNTWDWCTNCVNNGFNCCGYKYFADLDQQVVDESTSPNFRATCSSCDTPQGSNNILLASDASDGCYWFGFGGVSGPGIVGAIGENLYDSDFGGFFYLNNTCG